MLVARVACWLINSVVDLVVVVVCFGLFVGLCCAGFNDVGLGCYLVGVVMINSVVISIRYRSGVIFGVYVCYDLADCGACVICLYCF